MKTTIILVITLALGFSSALAATSPEGLPIRTITQSDIHDFTCFSADSVYLLDGTITVDRDQMLAIAPGAIIKGLPGESTTDHTPGTLVIAAGGKLQCVGSASAPIIFTAAADNVNDHTDMPLDQSGRGLWGGIVIRGDSGLSGGAGHLGYVSIRHAGEVQLENLGAETRVSHIEVFCGAGHGLQVSGGAVNLDHIAVGYNEQPEIATTGDWTGTTAEIVPLANWADVGRPADEVSTDHANAWIGCWTALRSGGHVASTTEAADDCCRSVGRGNIDGSADRAVSLGDLTALLNHLFVDFAPLPCAKAANLDNSPDDEITLGDLTVLVNHLFVNFDQLPACQ